jgi:hypothetical protein
MLHVQLPDNGHVPPWLTQAVLGGWALLEICVAVYVIALTIRAF